MKKLWRAKQIQYVLLLLKKTASKFLDRRTQHLFIVNILNFCTHFIDSKRDED